MGSFSSDYHSLLFLFFIFFYMTNTMTQGVEAVEEMGPQMSGTVTILNEKY